MCDCGCGGDCGGGGDQAAASNTLYSVSSFAPGSSTDRPADEVGAMRTKRRARSRALERKRWGGLALVVVVVLVVAWVLD